MEDMNDFMIEIRKLLRQRERVLEKIALEAKPIIPVLLDHKLGNSAKSLQELMFELDATNQELMELLVKDPKKTIALFGG
jgi:hypothetical protein